MDRTELLLLVNLVVANENARKRVVADDAKRDLGKNVVSLNIGTNIGQFFEIMNRFYTLDGIKKTIYDVSVTDVQIRNQKSPDCSYKSYIELIRGMLTSDDVKLETNWTFGRLSSTMKTLFIAYKYGGVVGFIKYVNLIYEVFPPAIQCMPIERFEEFKKQGFAVMPILFMDYKKLSKELGVPLSIIPSSFYTNPANITVLQHLRKNGIISNKYITSDATVGITNDYFKSQEFKPTDLRDDEILRSVTKARTLALILVGVYTMADRTDLKKCRLVEPFNHAKDLVRMHFNFMERLNNDRERLKAYDSSGKCLDTYFTKLARDARAGYALWIDDRTVNIDRLTNAENHHPQPAANYELRKCMFDKILRKHRYDFLKLGLDNELVDSKKIFFEKNNFSTLFDAEVLSDLTAQGVVWKLMFHTHSIPVSILKYATGNGPGFSNILHEIAVGLVLNYLKEDVPNFMYTWGGFICTPPTRGKKLVSPTKSVEYSYDFNTMCTNNSDNPHAIMLSEFIQGIPFNDIWDSLDELSVKKILFQIACALDVAQKRFEFVHNDLHGGNVLVRELHHEATLKYGKRKIRTAFIPVIIDYGYATVKYKDFYLPAITDEYRVFNTVGILTSVGDTTDILTLIADVPYMEKYKLANLTEVIDALYTDINQ